MGDVAQLCLNTQQLVQTIQECQAAFVKLVAVFRQFQQRGFPNAVQLLHGLDGRRKGLHALKLRPAVADHHLLGGLKLAGIEQLRFPKLDGFQTGRIPYAARLRNGLAVAVPEGNIETYFPSYFLLLIVAGEGRPQFQFRILPADFRL